MTNSQKILNLLGMATRARKVLLGYDTVINNLANKNKVFLVFVAKDASDKTKEKFVNKCYYYKTLLIMDFNCDELSKSVGKTNVKIAAICDQGLSESLKKLLKEGVNYES